MSVTMRRASAHDLGDLLELMGEFYGEAGYSLNPTAHAPLSFPSSFPTS